MGDPGGGSEAQPGAAAEAITGGEELQPTADSRHRLGIGVRVERSGAFQVAVSMVMLTLIACLVLWNLPAGRPRQGVSPVVDPVIQAVGMEQYWQLFAPDPRDYSLALDATVTYANGRVEIFDLPHNGLFLSPYTNYRWQKYVERATADADRSLWEPTALWFARHAGGHVVKVVLTRVFRYATVPGAGPRSPVQSYVYYTLTLP